MLSSSDDDGRTFSAPEAMALPLSDGTRCYDPCLWIDPKGRLWYLFNRSVKDSPRHGVYRSVEKAFHGLFPLGQPPKTPRVFEVADCRILRQQTISTVCCARICEAPDASPPAWGEEFRVGFDGPFSFRMNKPIVLSTGEWIMPVTHALEPVAGWAGFDPTQVHGAAVSTDEGKKWMLHGAVKMPAASLRR